jgi:hypothetical protein
MICTFHVLHLGRCTVQRQAFGKHGFCAPKFFTVSALDVPAMAARTYRFVDNAISGVHPSDLHNDTLCRIAIAQFLAGTDDGGASTAGAADLDVSIAPYAGDVTAPNGKRLRPALVPTMYARAPCEAGA